MEELSRKEKGLMDMDKSMMTVGQGWEYEVVK